MAIVRRQPAAIFDVVDGQAVVCDTSSGELFELNDTGKMIWELCDGRSEDGIVADVCALYDDVDPNSITADVRAYLTALKRAGLAEISE